MKTKKSKGKRLNWSLLKDVKPVKLNESITKGRQLSETTWLPKEKQNLQSISLVP